MRLGFSLPFIGPAASPEAIITLAQRAEALGYDSLWTGDRLLFPHQPQSPYAGVPGRALPEAYRINFDPLQTLTFAAAHTSQIRLGVSILVLGFYNPVLLARSLTTIDILSGGRLLVGLGQGWSQDEYDATGVAVHERGARADEFMQVLKLIWSNEVVEFDGRYFHIPRSTILPKPIQQPHPPIYLAARSPGAIRRLAQYADGWNPAVVVDPATRDAIQAAMQAAGRDPSTLDIVLRANFFLSADPLPDDRRRPFSGSAEQLAADIEKARAAGAHEIFFDPTVTPTGATLDSFLESMEQIRELVG